MFGERVSTGIPGGRSERSPTLRLMLIVLHGLAQLFGFMHVPVMSGRGRWAPLTWTFHVRTTTGNLHANVSHDIGDNDDDDGDDAHDDDGDDDDDTNDRCGGDDDDDDYSDADVHAGDADADFSGDVGGDGDADIAHYAAGDGDGDEDD
eukprot:2402966-Pyramimonas_sp.AAC.2